jgi:DNA-binding transcriptional MerR regulator
VATTQSPSPPAPLRIDEIAQVTGIASGTIRFYQREGLIPPPERDGRVAYYGPEHVWRLERVRALQGQGLPLALIKDLLEREEGGQDISAWLALDSAVFGPRGGGEPVAPEALARLGLEDGEVQALVQAGVFRQTEEGGIEALPGMVELTRRLLAAGVEPRTIRAGAERVSQELRGVAEAMADLGWDVFSPERERIEADQHVAMEVLAKLEGLRALAERIVVVLFPQLLDEEIRRRSEPYAVDVVQQRGAREN